METKEIIKELIRYLLIVGIMYRFRKDIAQEVYNKLKGTDEE